MNDSCFRRCCATSAISEIATISGLLLPLLLLPAMATDNATVPVDPCREFNTGGMPAMNEFASPGYPERYRPGLDCVRIIYAPPHYDVLIHFNELFQIETSYELTLPSAFSRHDVSRCPNDFLEVRDGRYGFSPLIGRFCGMTVPQFEVRAKSGYVYLRFHSDYLLEYAGFHAEYEFVRSDVLPKYEP
uniref:CUB domain-containing protein n=1 Tax=Steinernema glaseri TaxID=37863 RepID=A0A1I7YKA3_9BILA